MFAGSIYCTLFLLDCFHFAHECICICVYSVTLSIVVINLCLYIGLLQFSGVFPFFSLFPFFCFFPFLFYNLHFLVFFKPDIFSIFIPLFAFPTVLFPLQLIFNVYKSSSSNSIYFAYLFFLSLFFPLNIFVSFGFIALFPTWHLALVLFFSVCLR